jgi:hypothetical protein
MEPQPVTDREAAAAAALVAALGALHEPAKDGKVNAGARRYTYLTLPDLLTAVRATFAGHGLAIMQHVETVDVGVRIRTAILHHGGTVFESPWLVLPSGRAPQDVGSAITYGRRYSLAAFVGLAGDDDDDGATASRPPQRPTATPIDNRSRPDASDRPPRPATWPTTRKLWALLRGTGMSTDECRAWVAAVLPEVGPEWHTDDLTQEQAGALITRLEKEAKPDA